MGQKRTFFPMLSKEVFQNIASFPNQPLDKRNGLKEHISTCNMCLLAFLDEAIRKHMPFSCQIIVLSCFGIFFFFLKLFEN